MVGEGLNRIGEDIIIEDMKLGDLPDVIGIEKAVFTTPWSEISFFNELKNPRSFLRVAKKRGRVVGYICAGWILDEGHVLDVAVHPQYQRLGIAAALISMAMERLKEEGCRFVFLEVRESNEAAKKIYAKFGFELLGTRKNYYLSPEEDAVIMVLRFGG